MSPDLTVPCLTAKWVWEVNQMISQVPFKPKFGICNMSQWMYCTSQYLSLPTWKIPANCNTHLISAILTFITVTSTSFFFFFIVLALLIPFSKNNLWLRTVSDSFKVTYNILDSVCMWHIKYYPHTVYDIGAQLHYRRDWKTCSRHKLHAWLF